ncbi:hypothetical protein CPCC7001_1809 [Cyanobium sp. PCC 7001]|nr:hypothetical protein CPCC7001_1809 [Cyanobium sp. PCC 7001]
MLGLLAIGAGLAALESSRRPPGRLPPLPAPQRQPQGSLEAAPPGRTL